MNIRVCTACSLHHCSYVTHTWLAKKRTGDAEISWRPAPEKSIETVPAGAKTSPEICLVDLGRDTRTNDSVPPTCSEERRLELIGPPERIFWRKCSSLCLYGCCAFVYICFGRVLSRLD